MRNIETAALTAGLDLISHLYVVIIIKPTFLGVKCGDVGAVMAATASQNKKQARKRKLKFQRDEGLNLIILFSFQSAARECWICTTYRGCDAFGTWHLG